MASDRPRRHDSVESMVEETLGRVGRRIDGRSILMIESTYESGGELESNILWSYGHATIPRHLRDLVVTPKGLQETLLQKAVVFVLASGGYV